MYKLKKTCKSTLFAAAILAMLNVPAQAQRFGNERTQPIDMVVIHSTGGPGLFSNTKAE